MQGVRIALLVDNPYRDLAGLVLLATELIRRGATCYLIPMDFQRYEITALMPDFVLLCYLRQNNEQLVASLLDAKIQVGVLDTEGGVFSSLEIYKNLTSNNDHTRRQIKCLCAWGPVIADYAKNHGLYREDQVYITGTPRSDFYHRNFESKEIRNVEQQIEKYKPFILVNGNFPIANPQFTTPEKELEHHISRFNYERRYIEDIQQTQMQAMHGLVDVTNTLANYFENINFVYRPHPFEHMDTYKVMLANLPNLHLIRSGTVDYWIQNALAVVQRGCSTAIEAGLANVPSLSVQWLPTASVIEAVDAVSVRCDSLEVLISKIHHISQDIEVRSPDISIAIDAVIQNWYYKFDGNAYKRVADAIEKTYDPQQQPDRHQCKSIHYAIPSTAGFRAKLRRQVSKFLSISVTRSLRHPQARLKELPWDSSPKKFDAEAICSLLAALSNEYKVQNSTDIKHIKARKCTEVDYHFNYDQGRSVVIYST